MVQADISHKFTSNIINFLLTMSRIDPPTCHQICVHGLVVFVGKFMMADG
jgi:hypothetical protein